METSAELNNLEKQIEEKLNLELKQACFKEKSFVCYFWIFKKNSFWFFFFPTVYFFSITY